MELFRREVDALTRESVKIEQAIYRNGDDVIVLDKGESPPSGYEEISLEDLGSEDSK